MAPNGQLGLYALLPTCTLSWYQNGTGEDTQLSGVTSLTSHELAEGCADPVTGSTYSLPSTLTTTSSPTNELQYVAWAAVTGPGGGEIADMCAQFPDSFITDSNGYGYQKYWSNKNAAAGLDPCIPSSGTYFNTVPTLTDMVDLSANNANLTFPIGEALGIKLSQGQSATIPLTTFGPWQPSTRSTSHSRKGATARSWSPTPAARGTPAR
jgi:hypothetical protein